GQYLIYRSLVRQLYPLRAIYLAIPNYAYHGVFTKIAMPVVKEAAIKLIVVDLADEVIEQWLE
ncbi:MAG: fatty-acid synthase, partial [Burkholderiales bacterium]|nr:fatty-acid synthase [Anaerolineae bacterium]